MYLDFVFRVLDTRITYVASYMRHRLSLPHPPCNRECGSNGFWIRTCPIECLITMSSNTSTSEYCEYSDVF